MLCIRVLSAEPRLAGRSLSRWWCWCRIVSPTRADWVGLGLCGWCSISGWRNFYRIQSDFPVTRLHALLNFYGSFLPLLRLLLLHLHLMGIETIPCEFPIDATLQFRSLPVAIYHISSRVPIPCLVCLISFRSAVFSFDALLLLQ